MERWSFRFYGTVQGVGFRYRAHYAAERLGLTGWVANYDDGSVYLEVQGPPEALKRVVRTIQNNSRYIQISHIQLDTSLPLVENERGFRVRSGGAYGW